MGLRHPFPDKKLSEQRREPTTKSTHTWRRSVLTRILPWGVPGPPLLRNRGPVRTLGGQSYENARYEEPEPALQIVCYMKYLPDPMWRKRCLRFRGGVYDVVGRAWDQ